MNRMIFTGLNVLVWCFCLDAMVINGKEMNRVVARDSVSGARRDTSTAIGAVSSPKSTSDDITTPTIAEEEDSVTPAPDPIMPPSIVDEGDSLPSTPGASPAPAITDEGEVLTKNPSPWPKVKQDPLPKLVSAQNQAIAGTIMFGSSILLEQFVLNPWANRVSEKFSGAKTEEDSMQASGEALTVLAASLPVGILKVAGPTLACIGATRSYRNYHDIIDPTFRDLRVWRPYAAGWVLGAIGSAFGFIGGMSGSQELLVTGAMFSLGRDVTWSVATIWSLAYTVTTKNTVLDKGHVYLIPCSENGYGFTLRMDY